MLQSYNNRDDVLCTQFVTVQSRICSSHPHRFQIWEPRAFHVHKSLKYIEVSFIQHMIHKGRQFSQYNTAIQHVTEAEINSQIWVLVLGVPEVLGVPWGLGDPLHGLPVCMRLIKTISILHIVLNFVHVYNIVSVILWATLSPLGPGSPGVPGKPGGPSGPCV